MFASDKEYRNQARAAARTKSKLRLEERRENQRIRRLNSSRLKKNLVQPDIARGHFLKVTKLLPLEVVKECSSKYLNIIQRHGNLPTHYNYHEWSISRSFINEGNVTNDVLHEVFKPLISVSKEKVESLFHSGVEVDSACGHLYDADTPGIETGASWSEHRDYLSSSEEDILANASIIIQGYTEESFDGGGLTMRVKSTDGKTKEDVKTFVQLNPGDAIILRQTWHLPHNITRGRRLVFVIFFRKSKKDEKKKESGEKEKEKEEEDSGGETKMGSLNSATTITNCITSITTNTTTKTTTTVHTSQLQKDHDEDGNKTFNGYALLSLVARGSFGKVKLACKTNDDGTKMMYAVKIYSKSTLGRKKMSLSKSKIPTPLDGVRHEINIMSRLNHSNILKLYEVVDDEHFDKIYLITEWINDGASMVWNPNTFSFHFQGINIYSEDLVRNAFIQLASAIDYLHRIGIAHHDIKPENILRRGKGDHVQFILCDFGVAMKYSSDDVKVNSTKGTHAFFAPEMCSGVSDKNDEGKTGGSCDNSGFSPFISDVWSLGVTMYAYLYGRLPFWDARGGQCLFDAILYGELDVPKYQVRIIDKSGGSNEERTTVEIKLSAGVRNLLQLMLAKNIRERPLLSTLITNNRWLMKGEMIMNSKEDSDEEDVVSF
jgi:serine/threonine protein kinase